MTESGPVFMETPCSVFFFFTLKAPNSNTFDEEKKRGTASHSRVHSSVDAMADRDLDCPSAH